MKTRQLIDLVLSVPEEHYLTEIYYYINHFCRVGWQQMHADLSFFIACRICGNFQPTGSGDAEALFARA
ncbi:hypothetical protein [Paenibacillus sp. MER TA 81-3]|uniref:hypothetical protein n=1 Tax=Paenibacillus sp. MER TA 81-3 TaxID=2939573 RepID=UPI00203FFDBD|nr:hypothetical protein [Paenibacillus sp. MER TA 81-3]